MASVHSQPSRNTRNLLRLSEREILRHAGKISHDAAEAKAETEYYRFAEARAALPAPVDKHFEEAIQDVKQLEQQRELAQRPAP